jgi:hypothetical protein
MSAVFAASDIKNLERLFGVSARLNGNVYRFEIAPADEIRKLALEIYPDIRIGTRRGSLLDVYTPAVHLQLHFCSGYVVSEELGEVTFVGEHRGKLSGLIVERGGGCSLFANLDRSIVSGDFTRLGPEVMLSGVALSLTDTILSPASGGRKRRPTARTKKAARR